MSNGMVFGTSSEVESLEKVIRMCMAGISDTNQKGKTLLSVIQGSESDTVYQQAKEILDYVEKAVEKGQEPLEQVSASLNAYAGFLEAHGK